MSETESLFDQLWRNHPALQSPPVIAPCATGDTANFDNQCAIRLGLCLINSGISLASYPGTCCWYGHGKTHPIRVEELMKWLNSEDVRFVGYAEISKRDKQGRQKSADAYKGLCGIVACRNFWGTNNQGDHIDLWDGSTMAHGASDYFGRSEEIWSWKMAR